MNALATGTIAERKAEVAKTTGREAERVDSVRLDVGRLLKEGLLVDIDLHGFTCLRTGVTWKELGISAEDARRKRVQRGTKTLVPLKYSNKLKSLETRFRASTAKYTFDLAILRPWIWIPTTAWDAWRKEWDGLQAELAAFQSDLIANLGEITEQNIEYFKSVARKAWTSYHTEDDDSAVITPEGKVFKGYEAFEDDIVTSALAKVPSSGDILSIRAEYKTGFLLLPPEVLSYYGEAAAKTEIEYAESRKARAEADKAETEARQARWAQTDREATQAAKLDAIRRAEYDRAREQLAETVSPLSEILYQFRDRIYRDIVDISASLKKNGTLVGQVGSKARGLRDLYHLLADCTNDTELEAALTELNSALDKPGTGRGKYDAEAVETALAGVVEITKGAAAELRRQTPHSTVANFLEL